MRSRRAKKNKAIHEPVKASIQILRSKMQSLNQNRPAIKKISQIIQEITLPVWETSHAIQVIAQAFWGISHVIQKITRTFRETSYTIWVIARTVWKISHAIRVITTTIRETSPTVREISQAIGSVPQTVRVIIRGTASSNRLRN